MEEHDIHSFLQSEQGDLNTHFFSQNCQASGELLKAGDLTNRLNIGRSQARPSSTPPLGRGTNLSWLAKRRTYGQNPLVQETQKVDGFSQASL